MIILDVLIDGQKYRLPNAAHDNQMPILRLIQKGISHIFKPVDRAFPGHQISVTWDEDQNQLSYSSETLEKSQITEVLRRNHGIDL
ncbi:MAG TPA: hypothetical protein VNV85_16935 [Puia sp.]|jgi:hypothetical protein|nr:hypothetical protein [Puia sp.]